MLLSCCWLEKNENEVAALLLLVGKEMKMKILYTCLLHIYMSVNIYMCCQDACISVTGIELLLSAGMSIHFRSGNSSTRHDQFLAKVMPNFSVNSNSFSSSISESHHGVSRRIRGALQ